MNAAGLGAYDADNAVAAVFDHITNALARGDTVQLLGFGSFQVKERAAHSGRHPGTGEALEIPASKQVHFRAGTALKAAVKTE